MATAKIGLCKKPLCPNNLLIIVDVILNLLPNFDVFESISGNNPPRAVVPTVPIKTGIF